MPNGNERATNGTATGRDRNVVPIPQRRQQVALDLVRRARAAAQPPAGATGTAAPTRAGGPTDVVPGGLLARFGGVLPQRGNWTPPTGPPATPPPPLLFCRAILIALRIHSYPHSLLVERF